MNCHVSHSYVQDVKMSRISRLKSNGMGTAVGRKTLHYECSPFIVTCSYFVEVRVGVRACVFYEWDCSSAACI